jgi:hypothetical protein
MEWLKGLVGQRVLGTREEIEEIPPSLRTGAREFVDSVAPSELQIGRDEVAMPTQGVLTRTWWVEDLPDRMIFESLDPLLHFPGRVAVSILVEPILPAEAMQSLRQERSSRYVDRRNVGLHRPRPAGLPLRSRRCGRLAIDGEGTGRLQIARRFPLSLYWIIGLSAHDGDEMDDLGQKMEELLLTSGLVYHQATWRHESALKSLLPLGVNFPG